ncbi:unnamed protein product [Arabidopsis arenosa]|uniref:Uncharacterized protein n=1 Tax=Arabidopsis arenosa TaxID=38785 RepID=A0A8S2AYD4_ARAAE|nr:unnamed protein product [Arabidopsis arenosa]
MSRKFTYAEKGKRVASSEAPPRSELLPASRESEFPAFDDSELRRLPELEEIPLLPVLHQRNLIEKLRTLRNDLRIDLMMFRSIEHRITLGPRGLAVLNHRRDYGNRSRDSHWSKDRDGYTSRRYGENKSLSPQRSYSYQPSGHHSHSLPAFEERRKTRSPYKFEESRRSYPRVANAVPIQIPGSSLLLQRTAHPGPCLPAREASTEIPQAALNVAMGELRDVMIKYVNCADPTKAQRREKDIDKQKNLGQFEEQLNRWKSQVCRFLLKDFHESPTTLSVLTLENPATLRLGPPELPQRLVKSKKRVTGKKKLGRPPGNEECSPKESKNPLSGRV